MGHVDGYMVFLFEQFDELFRPYTKYCAEQSQCQQYCREKHNENELFTAYLVVRKFSLPYGCKIDVAMVYKREYFLRSGVKLKKTVIAWDLWIYW